MKNIIRAVSLLILLTAAGLHAEAPNLLTYQGRLKEGGQAVTGTRQVEIKMCDAESGPTCYSTGIQDVAVSNGLFRSTFSVPGAANFGAGNWYLEIWVNTVKLSPREQLTSTAYSMFSATAAYATNISAAMGSNGVYISSNIFVTSGGKYYGDGSELSGVTASSVAANGVKTGPLNWDVIASSIAIGAVQDDAIVSVSASKLTGALPALDAGLLTNLPVSGGAVAKAGDVMTGPLQTTTMTVTGQDASGYSLWLSSGINMAGGRVEAGLYSGSGELLTALNAASLASGIVPLARLSGVITSTAVLQNQIDNVAVSTGAIDADLQAYKTVVLADTTTLQNVKADNSAVVHSTGDVMTGNLLMDNNSIITVTGSVFSVGTSTFVVVNGNVGIGTTEPAEKLTISGASNDVAVPLMRIVSSGAQVPLYFTSGSGDAYIKGDSGGDFAMGAEGFIAYEAGGFGETNEKMRITSAGDVGIGTSAPGYKLDVQGGSINASNSLCIAGVCKGSWESTGDNLGNHVATTSLNMANFQILNVSSLSVTGQDASGYSLWLSSGINMAGGRVEAGLYSGSGELLTALNADSLASGIVPLARLSGISNAEIAAAAAIADTKLDTIATVGKVANTATTAASANTAKAIVARDASGNFSAGIITAASYAGDGSALTGVITSTAVLQTQVDDVAVSTGAIDADLQGYKTTVQVSTAAIDSDLQTYKATVQTSTAGIVVNLNSVAVSTGAINTDLQGYKTTVQVSTAVIDSDLQGYKETVRVSTDAIVLSTGAIDTDLQGYKTTVQLSTGAIDTDLQGYKTMVQLSTAAIDADLQGYKATVQTSTAAIDSDLQTYKGTVQTSTAGIVVNLNSVAASTGAINTDLQGYKTTVQVSTAAINADLQGYKTTVQTSTAAIDSDLQTYKGTVQTSTAGIVVNLNSVAASTGAINADLQGYKETVRVSTDAIVLSTGQINTDLQAYKEIVRISTDTIVLSTGAINADLQGYKTTVQVSTAVINADLQGYKTTVQISTAAIDVDLQTYKTTVQTSTAGIVVNLNSVAVSTGAINTDLQGYKVTVAVDTTTLKAQLDVKLSSALAVGNIFIGNESGAAAGALMSGDMTMSSSGVAAIGAGKVTNNMLAGSIADGKLNQITSSGKVADTALSANVALLDANQAIGGIKTFTSTVTVTGDAFSVGGSTLVVTAGNVGIGTMNPSYGLDVVHTNGVHLGTTSTSGYGLYVDNIGNVGVGTTPMYASGAGVETALSVNLRGGRVPAAIFQTAGNGHALNLRNPSQGDGTLIGLCFNDDVDNCLEIATGGRGLASIVAQEVTQDIMNRGGGNLIFYTAGFGTPGDTYEAMRIDHYQNIGIGTTSPKNKLDVEGSMAVGATYSGTAIAPTDGMIIQGSVGIGTTSPAEKLDVRGGSINTQYGISAATGVFSGSLAASSFTATSMMGIGAAQLWLGNNVVISSETLPLLGGGVRISSNVYIVGFSSAAKYYGDGSGLTSVGGASPVGSALTSANIWVGNASNQAAATGLTGDVTISNTGTTAIGSGKVTNAMLAGSIADSNLATITTTGKVSNSATTAASANTASAIVTRDASGNFSAGTITAVTFTGALNGNADTVTTNADLTGDVASVGNAAVLASTGTAGTYRSVTTDEKGRVTSGTNPTTLSGYGLTDAVQLQGSTPGTQQTGHLYVSGTGIFNGNIGIGTTNPEARLHVEGATTGDFGAKFVNNNEEAYVNNIFVNDDEIKAYVGVGGSILSSAYSDRAYLEASGDGTGVSLISPVNGDIRFYVGGTTDGFEKIRIDSDGKVGVGTTSPGSALDVNGVANAATGFRVGGAAALGNYLRGDGTNFVASALQAGDVASSIGGTPALTLGVTNSAGSATTFVRTDATLLAFDATAPAALGTAAAGSAAVAARRDHVHAAADLAGASTTGVLPVAKGGTNSSAALSGSTIMVSNGTSIVQGAVGTTTTLLHGNASGAPGYSAVALAADVSGILPSANGGTGNGFAKFNGPTTAEKNFILPDTDAIILTTAAVVTVEQGGTGAASLTGVVRGNGTGALTASAIADADVPDTITINGTDNVTWPSVNKTGSSLANLETRSAADLSSGILPLARLSGIRNSELAAGAGIMDTKLDTITTAGKVSNSATTAASANTASAIVARDSSGNFTAGIITATAYLGSGAGLAGVIYSTAALQTQINDVAVSTGAINTDLQGYKTTVQISTAAINTDLQTYKTTVQTSTAGIVVNLNSVAVSTGAINADLQGYKETVRVSTDAIVLSTGQINTDLQAYKEIVRISTNTIVLSTGAINTDLQGYKTIVQISTAAIDTDLQGYKTTVQVSTAAINADLQGYKTTVQISTAALNSDLQTYKTVVALDTTTLQNVKADNSAVVHSTGDVMTGGLVMANSSTITVTGSAFSVGGSTLVVTAGNVGIGTAAPGSLLDVNGTAQLHGASGGTGLYVNGSGNVGIGTTAPVAKLDLGTSGVAQTFSSGGLGWGGSTNTAGFRTAWSTGYGASFEAWDPAAPKWGIYKWNTTTPAVVMQGQYDTTDINFTGSVGIGTVAPLSKLDVLDGSITVRGMNAGLVFEDASRVIAPETTVDLGAGIRVSTNVYIVGFSSAAKYYGDGSGLTGVTVASPVGSELSSANIWVGNASNKATATGLLGDVTINNTGVTAIGAGKVTNAMLAGSIADSNLATITTSGKVSNSATTAASANTANAIVARDVSGNFTAGVITATAYLGSGAGLAGVIYSTAALQTQINDVAVSTGAINADLQGYKTTVQISTAAINTDLQTYKTTVQLSTAGIVVNLTNVAVSTGMINADLQFYKNTVQTSTAGIVNNLNSVAASTGAINTDLQSYKTTVSAATTTLQNVKADNSAVVHSTGDVMTGGLVMANNSTITVTGSAFSVGGSTLVVVNGNVGIGTNNPTAFMLDVNGSMGPDSNDVYDIGASNRNWNRVYVSTVIATNVSATNVYATSVNAATFSGGFAPAGFVAGPVVFGGAGGALAQNSALFWDNNNKYLGVGAQNPVSKLNISSGTLTIDGNVSNSIIVSGSVGIGTANPLAKLDVNGSIIANHGNGLIARGEPDQQIYISHDGSKGIVSTSYYTSGIDTPLTFVTASQEHVRIDTKGNVGVGTEWPQARLHVVSTSTTDSAVFIVSHALTGYGLFVSTSANVGVGTTSPAAKLDVQGGSINAQYAVSATSGVFSTALTVGGNDVLTTASGAVFLASTQTFTGSNTFKDITAVTINASSAAFTGNDGVYGLTVSSNVSLAGALYSANGNVGVGTANPAAALDVNGQVKISGGAPGANKVLTSDAGGLATWQVAPSTFSIGDSYGGGKIFWIDPFGKQVLIASQEDQNAGAFVKWSNNSNTTGATYDGIYAGKANTVLITASQGAGNYAARICSDYSVTVNNEYYDDWYLPSQYELMLLNAQKNVIGGTLSNAYHWSSTEETSTYSKDVNFFTDSPSNNPKTLEEPFRCVRAGPATYIGNVPTNAETVTDGAYVSSTQTFTGLNTFRNITAAALNASSATLTGNGGVYGLTVSSNVSLAGAFYTANGRIGIGAAAPAARLDVIESDTANSAYTLRVGTGTADYSVVVTTRGWVGLGNRDPKGRLHLVGSGEDSGIIIENVSAPENDLWNGPWIGSVRARNTAPGTVGVDDGLGAFIFMGNDGVDGAQGPFTNASAIRAAVDGAVADNSVPGRLEFYTSPGAAGLVARLVIKNDGSVGISTGNPQAALDVVSTGTGAGYYAQIWRNSSGLAVATMTADGQLYANLGNDGLGNHIATTSLDMAGYAVVNVSTIGFTGLDGGIVLAPYLDKTRNYAYSQGVAIGSNTYDNYSSGVGIGYNAYGNSGNGVGVGYGANNNNSSGVGIGNNASGNATFGVGVGNDSSGNGPFGVGVGNNASGNSNFGVGMGSGASGNTDHAVGIGAYSSSNKPYGSALGAYSYAASSSVALGSYAKANAKESIAIGAGTVNNDEGTANFGAYSINTSSSINAYALKISTGFGPILAVSSAGVKIGDLSYSSESLLSVQGLATDKNFGLEDISLGLETIMRTKGTGLEDIVAGGNFEVDVAGSDQASLVGGLRTSLRFNSLSHTKQAIGLMVDSLSNSGTIDTTYGIYIGTMTAGTQTNVPYALYSADKNAVGYFAGKVGIGTDTPAAKLEVTGGAIKATGGLIIETRTSDPVVPVTGQMWLRVD